MNIRELIENLESYNRDNHKVTVDEVDFRIIVDDENGQIIFEKVE